MLFTFPTESGQCHQRGCSESRQHDQEGVPSESLPMMLKLGDVTEARWDIKIAKIQKSGACCPRFRHISTRGMAIVLYLKENKIKR